jgi:branched-chain amino acid transport system ATP-binding protein
MLHLEDVHTYYGDSYILQGVSLEVPDRSVVAVLGRNGVGKTTLIRSIIGFTPPRRGRILLADADIAHLPAHRIAKLGVGLVPQGRRVFGSLSVQENLTVAEQRSDGRTAWTPARIFGVFPQLRQRLVSKGRNLSGGEQQMLATGRALVTQPRLMLMDEPTEGLSPLFVREMGKLVRALKEQGTAVLLVEQNLAFALALADDVYVMSKGRIVHHSTPDDLKDNRDVRARYLGV